jgi:hypothetical protein
MQDIDFLPAQYRQKYLRRRWQPWRVAVVAAVAALLLAGVFSQRNRKRQAEEELATILRQYDLAVRQNRRLAETWTELHSVRNTAELFTYLRHPWPRTQLLAAVLAPLPEGIDIEELQITHETRRDHALSERRTRADSAGEGAQLKLLPPAVRDLTRLRDEFDKLRTVVLISGTSGDTAALHRYLGELGNASLFSRAELDLLTGAENQPAGTLQYRATLVVRPGYGQPGGPTGPEKGGLAQTGRQSR